MKIWMNAALSAKRGAIKGELSGIEAQGPLALRDLRKHTVLSRSIGTLKWSYNDGR